jgi:Heparinase II/III-like protein/Heparinase II/III N-terminus
MSHENQVTKLHTGTIRRIAAMGWPEVAHRGAQELHKRADAILVGLGVDLSRKEIGRERTEVRRFFFRPEDVPGCLNILRERMPQQVETIALSAEKICRHRFDLLGYKDLDFGSKIDWHSDVVHGKRAPRELWFKIRYLDFSSVGDAKVTWELNRHQHFVTLAKAYRLTQDPRFASELIDQWQNWQHENPYPWGINWASSLEVAFRSLSWLWSYFLLVGTPAMTPAFRQQWLRAMALNARHIERYLSTYFSPNTHLLGEAVALLFIGTLCPELRSSSRWKRRGWQLVLRESARQVRQDGFHFEQSTYYHVYAVDFLLHASLLASLNEMPFPPEYDHRLEKMLEALALLCRAGSAPRWGDDDGGRVFDPQRNRAEHLSDPLATGAVLFGRGDFKSISGGLREETVWLLGEPGVARFDSVAAKQPRMDSSALPEAGLYVMSSNEALQAVIDAGPQGALRAGHGHADALSMTLHAKNCELVGDPGTHEYVGTGNERDEFRGTAAHNTLEIDERDQSEPAGPFAWKSLANAKAESWIAGETFDLFVGSHDGYSRLEHPAIHRRWVFFRKPRFWLVRDVMIGTGEHRLALHWRLHPGLSSSGSDKSQFSFPDGRRGIAFFSPSEQGWSRTVQKGPWSAAYGIAEDSTEVRYTKLARLPAEFATLLAPISMSTAEPDIKAGLVQVSTFPDPSAYLFTDNQEKHCFIFAPQSDWHFQQWKADAEFLYCCSKNGKLSHLVFCNGTYAEFDGVRIVSSPKRAMRCEIFNLHGKPQVFCSEDGSVVSQVGLSKMSDATATFAPDNNQADR